MFKQWLLVSLASSTFLLVWGIIIIQFYHMNQPTLPIREAAKVEHTEFIKGNDYSQEVEEQSIQSIEVVTETIDRNESIVVKDLRKIDFSDVRSPEGVSIDDILNRLELN